MIKVVTSSHISGKMKYLKLAFKTKMPSLFFSLYFMVYMNKMVKEFSLPLTYASHSLHNQSNNPRAWINHRCSNKGDN